jgi:hypothetical protein
VALGRAGSRRCTAEWHRTGVGLGLEPEPGSRSGMTLAGGPWQSAGEGGEREKSGPCGVSWAGEAAGPRAEGEEERRRKGGRGPGRKGRKERGKRKKERWAGPTRKREGKRNAFQMHLNLNLKFKFK